MKFISKNWLACLKILLRARYWIIGMPVLWATILSSSTHAQILNINKLDITSDSSGYYVGFFDFSFELDNRSPLPDEAASFLGVESSLDLVRVAKKNAYLLVGQLNHYQATGDPVISTGYLHFRVNFNRKKKLSYETYMQSLFDHSRHLAHRFLVGAGLKYQIYKNDKVEHDLGVGILNETEKWENLARDGTFTINNLFKFSNYYKLNVNLTKSTFVSFVVFYQVGYDDGIDAWRNRISTQIQLEFAINNKFSLLVEGSWSFEDKPVLPINRSIYSIKNGLRINF